MNQDLFPEQSISASPWTSTLPPGAPPAVSVLQGHSMFQARPTLCGCGDAASM